jgi:hypothetical protein
MVRVPISSSSTAMHLFEYALRDFINAERVAPRHGLIVIDDMIPNHPAQAARERRTKHWTGDVWKIRSVLREHRPDLYLLPLDTSPTGMLIVAGLNPASRVLRRGTTRSWRPMPQTRRFRRKPFPAAMPSSLMVRRSGG